MLAWVGNPLTALLAVPALHLWLPLAPPRLARGRRARRAVSLGLASRCRCVLFYAHQLGLGAGGVAWTGVLLLAGGHIGLLGVILWSVALGCAAAAALLALDARRRRSAGRLAEETAVTIRGPSPTQAPGHSVERSQLCDDRRAMSEAPLTSGVEGAQAPEGPPLSARRCGRSRYC